MFFPSVKTVVFVAESHLAVFVGEQSVVGQSDTMRVAAQIIQDMCRSAEGWFGVDHPFGLGGGKSSTGGRRCVRLNPPFRRLTDARLSRSPFSGLRAIN